MFKIASLKLPERIRVTSPPGTNQIYTEIINPSVVLALLSLPHTYITQPIAFKLCLAFCLSSSKCLSPTHNSDKQHLYKKSWNITILCNFFLILSHT